MDNVIKGKFSELEDVSSFIQPENGDRAIDVALGLNEDIDEQGMCNVTIWHSSNNKPFPGEEDLDEWYITYNFPDGYEYSYHQASFKNLEDAAYFVLFSHIVCSEIENKSIRCLTPGDALDAIRLKTKQKYIIKVDLVEVKKPNKRKAKKKEKAMAYPKDGSIEAVVLAKLIVNREKGISIDDFEGYPEITEVSLSQAIKNLETGNFERADDNVVQFKT